MPADVLNRASWRIAKERTLEAAAAIGCGALFTSLATGGYDVNLAFAALAVLVAGSASAGYVHFEQSRAGDGERDQAASSDAAAAVVLVGLFALSTYAAVRFNRVAFASPLVRRVGISMSVGAMALGLCALHNALSRWLTRWRVTFAVAALPLCLALALAFALSATRAGVWRVAPLAWLLLLGAWSAWRQPLQRVRSRRVITALQGVGAASWLALLGLALS